MCHDRHIEKFPAGINVQTLTRNVSQWFAVFLIYLTLIPGAALADIPCNEEICIGMPQVSGDNVNGVYFNGIVDVDVDIQDYEAFGFNREVSFSFNGGETWESAQHYEEVPFGADYQNYGNNAQILPLNSGRVLLTWTERNYNGNDPVDFNIYTKIYNPDGTIHREQLLAANRPLDSDDNPYVFAVNSTADTFFLAWNEGNNINSIAFNESGDVVRNLYQLNSESYHPNITELIYYQQPFLLKELDQGAGFLLLFINDQEELRLKIFDTNGDATRSEFSVTPMDEVNDTEIFDIAPLKGTNTGGFVIAWHQGESIYSQMYDGNGSKIGSQQRLEGSRAYWPYTYARPKVVGNDSGGYLVSYIRLTDHEGTETYRRDTNQVHVSYTRFSANGSVIVPIVRNVWSEPLQDSQYQDGLVYPTVGAFDYVYQDPYYFHLAPNILDLGGENILIQWHTFYFYRGTSQNAYSVDKYHTLTNSFRIINQPTVPVQHDKHLNVYSCLPNNRCPYMGAYIRDIFKLPAVTDTYLVKNPGNSYHSPRLLLISKDKKASRAFIDSYIGGDADFQVRVRDLDTGLEYFSPVRHMIHVDPNAGNDGNIYYNDGFTAEENVSISINNTCTACDVLEVSKRTATLSGGTCGVFGDWVAIGSSSPSDTVRSIQVDDALCYQFKASLSNATFSIAHEYTSPNVVLVDRGLPEVTIQNSVQDFDALTLNLQITDSVSGLSSQAYDLNASGSLTSFTGDTLNLNLVNGVNRVRIEVTDQANNRTVLDHFITANLTPPQINIVGIEEGGVYSGDLELVYSFTQELTDVVIMVDGVQRQDLVGLADGNHTLVISGNYRGSTVTRTVNFVTDSSAFSFQLLSPQNNRHYQLNDIPIQYQANKAVSSLSYTLDGGSPQTELNLLDISNGDHQIVVTVASVDSETTTLTIDFSVHEATPELTVTSPLNGAVYPGLSVPLSYASTGDIQLQLDGDYINSVSNLTFSEDSGHTLVITSTHPVSGSMVSEVINFTTDSVAPSVTLQNPQPRLYPDRNIPIEYRSNKVLQDVHYYLDGVEVNSLNNTQVGTHLFRLTATDTAGRNIDIPVNFEVATLDIVRPTQDQRIVSNSMPPQVSVQYNAEGNFDHFTLGLDDQQPIILSTEQSPGSVFPVTVSPGDHDITLSGQINNQQVGKRVGFEVGAKNISVGPGSINYEYSNCNADFTDCDVVVELDIYNRGDYDVDDPIHVRFDHIDNNGAESQWVEIPSMASHVHSQHVLLPFTASLGDMLVVSIDPNNELPEEWADDNVHSVPFSAAQITDVDFALDPDNRYFEGVTVFNIAAVATTGPVAKVEFRYNGWVFENNDPENGFTTIVDMGLLDRNSPCIEIRAISSSNITLDTTMRCFNVANFALQGVDKYQYTWDAHQTNTRHVIYDQINIKEMLLNEANLHTQLLARPAAIISVIEAQGRVDYKFYYDEGSFNNRLADRVTRWSSDGFLNGNIKLPDGQMYAISNIDPTRGVCNVEGAIPINMPNRQIFIEEYLAEQIAVINRAGSLFDGLNSHELAFLFYFRSFNFVPYMHSTALYSVENFAGDLAGIFGDSDYLEELMGNIRDNNALFDFMAGLLDLKLVNIGILYGHIPSELFTVTTEGSFVNRFVGDHCVLADEANGDIEVRLEGYFEWGLENVAFNIHSEGLHVGLLNYTGLSWGPPDFQSKLSLLSIPLFLTHADFKLYELNARIPVDFGVRHGIKITDNTLDEFGPFHARFSIRSNIDQLMAKADVQVYPLFTLPGLGAGADYRFYLKVISDAKFDMLAVSGYGDEFKHYVNYDISAKLYKRKKICFLGRCHHRSWKVNKILFEKPEPGENIPFGSNYTRQDVNQYLDTINAPWRYN
jgi:hypothetical protein